MFWLDSQAATRRTGTTPARTPLHTGHGIHAVFAFVAFAIQQRGIGRGRLNNLHTKHYTIRNQKEFAYKALNNMEYIAKCLIMYCLCGEPSKRDRVIFYQYCLVSLIGHFEKTHFGGGTCICISLTRRLSRGHDDNVMSQRPILIIVWLSLHAGMKDAWHAYLARYKYKWALEFSEWPIHTLVVLDRFTLFQEQEEQNNITPSVKKGDHCGTDLGLDWIDILWGSKDMTLPY